MFMKKIYTLMLICSLLFSFGCNEGDTEGDPPHSKSQFI